MRVIGLSLVGIVGALWASLAGADHRSRYNRAEPELLLFDPVPMVMSATWAEKSALDASNAATGIMDPDIHASGATSPPQRLR